MSIANCTKNYSRAYVYITFVHYGFGLHTYHISLKVQFFLACIHTVTYHSSKKIKYPKEVKKTSQGDANELKQGSRNLGQGGRGGNCIHTWAEIEAKLIPLKDLLLLLAPPTRFSYLPAALTETIPRVSNRAVRTMGEIPLPKY